MKEGELVLRNIVVPGKQGKLQPNKERPFHIFHKLPHAAYKLEDLDGRLIHMILNSIYLKYYS